jgi:hypothetical protein
MRKYAKGAGLFFFLFCFFLFPQVSYAHFPATDGNMTVVLHVDPYDDPVPGQKAVLHFLFTDSKEHFTLEKCACTVTISEEGQQLFSKQFTNSGNPIKVLWGNAVPFIFPNRDVYTIKLVGKPKVKNAFQPFELKWYFRVDQYPQTGQGQNDPTFIYFMLFYFGIILCTGTVIYLVIRY